MNTPQPCTYRSTDGHTGVHPVETGGRVERTVSDPAHVLDRDTSLSGTEGGTGPVCVECDVVMVDDGDMWTCTIDAHHVRVKGPTFRGLAG